uniref:Transmembrane protein 53 (inferred by orthology to a human protein) n=1 Tax=Parastrongyloides trichosuri TaxID=131310 RepID=A0A0N5A478_PARTI
MEKISKFEVIEGGNYNDKFDKDNNNTPLICLFGWAGCKDRYLCKYASFYENAGHLTLRATAPIEKIRNLNDYTVYGDEFYKRFISIPSIEKRKVFYHIFSMNGASMFLKFYEKLLNDNNVSIQSAGIIFDSCPADVKPMQGALAISYALYPPSKYGSITTMLTKFILAVGFAGHRYMIYLESLLCKSAYERSFAYYKLISMNSLPKHQLYLFSEKDNICSSTSIKEFVKQQETTNNKTFEKIDFTDSEHVQHFRSYPDEYTSKCLQFITNSIPSSE